MAWSAAPSRPTGNAQIEITARLFSVRSLESAFGVVYSGSNRNVRLYAHQLSDELHRHQRGLTGVARTRIAFVTDRYSESVLGLVDDRPGKEIIFADYDGANVRRVTVSRSINTNPAWSPDGRSIAYTSWLSGFPEVLVSYIYEGRMTRPANGNADDHNFLPAFSSDGSQIAFMSNRGRQPPISTS